MELLSQSRQLQKSGVKAADGPNGFHSILLFACVSFIHSFLLPYFLLSNCHNWESAEGKVAN